MPNVEVIALRPHVERQRRYRGERYFIKPERAAKLVARGWVELVHRVELQEKVEAEAKAEAEAAKVAEAQQELQDSDLDVLVAKWQPKYSPEEYLRRWPTGQHAALALEIQAKLETQD